MVGYYQKYRTSYLALKIRTIYINNMLSKLEVPDDIDPYKPDYIGVDTDQLHMDTTMYRITLTYHIPYESYTDEWDLPIEWIDMEDEDIKRAFIQYANEQLQAEVDRKDKTLRSLAEYLGYELVRKETE